MKGEAAQAAAVRKLTDGAYGSSWFSYGAPLLSASIQRTLCMAQQFRCR